MEAIRMPTIASAPRGVRLSARGTTRHARSCLRTVAPAVASGSIRASPRAIRPVPCAASRAAAMPAVGPAKAAFGSSAKNLREGVVAGASAAAVPAPVDDGKISESEGIVNVIKSIMGAGAFSLPWAYAQSGTYLSNVVMVVACAISLYTLDMMVRAKNNILRDSPNNKYDLSTYSGLTAASIGQFGARFAELSVLSCVLGICSAYLVFIASTVKTLIPLVSAADPTQNFLVVCITPLMIALALIRNMSGLSFISLLGNFAVVLGMSCVGLHGFTATGATVSLASIPTWVGGNLAAAYGSIAFLFFVHFTLMPVDDAMRNRKEFMPAATKGFIFCAIISAAFGLMGAACFGPNVNSVVITHLEGTLISVIVKMLLCLNLLFTVPMASRGAFGIIEGWFPNMAVVGKNLLRIGFISTATLTATCIPSFGQLLGLVGGVSLTALTLVFPPLMLFTTDTKDEVSMYEFICGFLMALAGVAIMAVNIAGALA